MAMIIQKAVMGAKDGRNSKCIQELKRGTLKVLERRLKGRKKRSHGIKELAETHDGTDMKYLAEGR